MAQKTDCAACEHSVMNNSDIECSANQKTILGIGYANTVIEMRVSLKLGNGADRIVTPPAWCPENK